MPGDHNVQPFQNGQSAINEETAPPEINAVNTQQNGVHTTIPGTSLAMSDAHLEGSSVAHSPLRTPAPSLQTEDVVSLLQKQLSELSQKVESMQIRIRDDNTAVSQNGQVDRELPDIGAQEPTSRFDPYSHGYLPPRDPHDPYALPELPPLPAIPEPDPDPIAFGSIPECKILQNKPNDGTSTRGRCASPAVKPYAIVAFYDIPTSRTIDKEGDLTNVVEWGLLPVHISINSRQIIQMLESISGTTLGDEPRMMVAPYKVLLTHWEDIKDKLVELENKYKADFKETFDDAMKPLADSLPQSQTQSTTEDPNNAVTDTLNQPAENLAPDPAQNQEATDLTEGEPDIDDLTAVQEIDNETISTWRCLVNFIKTNLKSMLDLRDQIAKRKLENISFNNLWHLFNPGDIVLGRDSSGKHLPQAYQVFSVTKGRTTRKKHSTSAVDDSTANFNTTKIDDRALKLQCFYLDFDGTAFCPREEIRYIRPYLGEKKITELELYPKDYVSNSYATQGEDPTKTATNGDGGLQEFVKSLEMRGRRFIECRYGHGTYEGVTTRLHKEHIDGEVFVDFKSGYEDHPSWNHEIGSFGDIVPPEYSILDPYEPTCSMSECTTCANAVYADEQVDMKRCEAFKQSELFKEKVNDRDVDTLTSNQLILLPRHLLAYSLRVKQWHFIDVNDYERVNSTSNEKRKSGFENLVINPKHKQLLKAMVENHASTLSSKGNKNVSFGHEIDLVRGKGRGLIIFLYGPPGVGKTSTAETIAAYTTPARPLYTITCGDLGSEPIEIQKALEAHFKLAHRWNCVLLLDEADVYLAERTYHDLKRNGIVSVFLRTLEYYSGILFLTSNREGLIDEAFKSRIHIALRYKAIDAHATQQIWRNTLNRIQEDNTDLKQTIKIHFADQSLLEWADKHYKDHAREGDTATWNGRQIRNAFQSAIALASFDRLKAIKEKHLTEEQALKKAVFRKVHLKTKHFEDVATVVQEFEEYLEDCRGAQDDVRAFKLGARADKHVTRDSGPSKSAYPTEQTPRDIPMRTPTRSNNHEARGDGVSHRRKSIAAAQRGSRISTFDESKKILLRHEELDTIVTESHQNGERNEYTDTHDDYDEDEYDDEEEEKSGGEDDDLYGR